MKREKEMFISFALEIKMLATDSYAYLLRANKGIISLLYWMSSLSEEIYIGMRKK